MKMFLTKIYMSGLWLLGALGCLGVLIYATWYYVDVAIFQQHGQTGTTSGTIIALPKDEDNDGGYACFLVIRFRTMQKRTVIFKPSVGNSDFCFYHVGDTVDVAYNLKNPSDARFIPPGGPWLGNLPLLIFAWLAAGILCVASFAAFISSLRLP